MNRKIAILIVDDHPLFRDGLKSSLNAQPDMQVLAEADSIASAIDCLQRQPVDVILLDLNLRDGSGWDLLLNLKPRREKPATLVVSAHAEEEFAVQSLNLGASGYFNKQGSVADLLAAIRRVATGGRYASGDLVDRLIQSLYGPRLQAHETLSEREFGIMMAIAEGKSLVTIADELQISPKTVTTYRRRLLNKLGLANNAEVTRYVLEKKLVS